MSCPLVRLSFNSAPPFPFMRYHSTSKAWCQYLAFDFVSLVRNSVVLAVYLLFSVACFFTVHEHCQKNSSVIHFRYIIEICCFDKKFKRFAVRRQKQGLKRKNSRSYMSSVVLEERRWNGAEQRSYPEHHCGKYRFRGKIECPAESLFRCGR